MSDSDEIVATLDANMTQKGKKISITVKYTGRGGREMLFGGKFDIEDLKGLNLGAYFPPDMFIPMMLGKTGVGHSKPEKLSEKWLMMNTENPLSRTILRTLAEIERRPLEVPKPDDISEITRFLDYVKRTTGYDARTDKDEVAGVP